MAPGLYKRQALLITLLLIFTAQGVVLQVLNLTLGFEELPPGKVIAYRNKPLLLNCTGYSLPEYKPLEIIWKHNSHDIQASKQQQILANGSLYVEKFQAVKKPGSKQDDGSYVCVLKNRLGVLLSRPTNVVTAYLSKQFSQQPIDASAEVGTAARFQCQITSAPPATYTWFFNDRLLPQADNRFVLQSAGSLSILDVSEADAGSYHCVAESGTRKRDSQKALLTVLEEPKVYQPPQFLSSSLQHIVVVNHSVILECLAKGWPAVKIQWRKLGGALPPHRTRILDPGNLEIKSVRLGDEGTYVCEASNVDLLSAQTEMASQQSILVVHSPPEFVTKPRSQENPAPQTTRFECLAQGVPTPSLQWFKDGRPLYINGRIKMLTGNVLVISQTILSDSGLYQCMAMNEAGSSVASARLKVNVSRGDQPAPPNGLKGTALSSSAIRLSWQPGISPNSLKIQAYTVHYLPTTGGAELQKVAVNTSQIIDKLLPYTNYTFYVRAYNGRSASEQSETITQVTGEDVPIEVPSLTLSSPSSSSLLVSWDKLPLEKSRGVITKYMIHHRKHNQASYSVIDVPGDIQEYTLTGLIPTQKYDVRVTAGTRAGFPNLDDSQWQWTTHQMPAIATSKVPSPPVLHLTVINSTTIEITWSAVTDVHAVHVKGYRLSYRQKGLPLQGPFEVSANVTSYLLTDLASQTWYEVHVSGFNEEGEGQESLRNILTLSEDNPDSEIVEVVEPPLELEADPIKASTVRLFWKAPVNSGKISYYTVRYGMVKLNGENVSSINYIRSTKTEVTIDNLTPFSLYAFAVRSHDANNLQGPFSEQTECWTLEDVPSAPELQWSVLNSSSIRLSWVPPSHPNGLIRGYQILFTSQPESTVGAQDLTLDKWQVRNEPGTQLSSVVSGLVRNTLYYFCLRAETGAGLGTPSTLIAVKIKAHVDGTKILPGGSTNEDFTDPFLGIVLGVSIGLCCIIICVAIIICRNRCYFRQQCGTRTSSCCIWCDCRCFKSSNHCLANGHSSRLPQTGGQKRASALDCQELESVTPMLTQLPNTFNHRDEPKDPRPVSNGHMNGLACQMRDRFYTNGLSHKAQAFHTENGKSVLSPCKSGLLPDSGWGDEEESSQGLVSLPSPCNQHPQTESASTSQLPTTSDDIPASRSSLANSKVLFTDQVERDTLDYPDEICVLQNCDDLSSTSCSYKQLPLHQYSDSMLNVYLTEDSLSESDPQVVLSPTDNMAVLAGRLQVVKT